MYGYLTENYPDGDQAVTAWGRSALMSAMLGDLELAKTDCEVLLTQFAGRVELPDLIYPIAMKFREERQYQDARRLQEYIVENYPDSQRIVLAWGQLAVLNVLVGDYDQAEREEKVLITQLAGRTELPHIEELPRLLDDIADKYLEASKYQDTRRYRNARRILGYILANRADSHYSHFVDTAMVRTPELDILLGDYDQARADTANLIAHFADHPLLPEFIYVAAYNYRQAEQYADARELCKHLLENHPNTDYAGNALGMKSLLEIRMGNYAQAQSDIQLLTARLTGRPELVSFLSEIAYEYYLAGKNEDYQRFHDYAAQNTFNSGDAIDRWQWLTLTDIRTGNHDPAECDTRMRASVVSHLYEASQDLGQLTERLYTIGKMFYLLAEEAAEQGEVEISRNAYLRAAAIWDEIDDLDGSEKHAKATIRSGWCYDKIEQLDKAFEYFQEFTDRWPAHQYVTIAIFEMAVRAKRAQELGQIAPARADEIFVDNLETIFVDYPYSTFAKESLKLLGDHHMEKATYGDACHYYEQLLDKDITHLKHVVHNYAAALEQLGEAETAEELWRMYAEMSQ